MKTIEERAKTRGAEPLTEEDVKVLHNIRGALSAFEVGYILGATEQKEIDDADLARLKKDWEKEAEINHDADKAYKQGYHDAIDKACEWLKANADKYIVDIGIRDVNLIIGDMCWVDFRKAMEE